MTSLLTGLLVAVAVWWWMTPLQPDSDGSERTPSTAGSNGSTEQSDPLPDVMDVAVMADLLAMVLRSGMGVAQAVELVGRTVGGRLGGDLLTVHAAEQWGWAAQVAWSRLPTDWASVRRALTLSREAGIPPADLLVAAAADARQAERHRLEVSIAQLGIKVVLPLGLAFLPGFALTTVVPVVLALAGDILGR